MSGMFQRIARRHADRPDDPAATDASADRADDAVPAAPGADAPTEAMAPIEPPPGDAPTTFQPIVSVAPPAPAASDLTTIAPAVTAATSATPAPADAPATPPAAEPQPAAVPQRRPGFRARGRVRRRLRYLRKLRELQVRDLGGLVFDLRRFERKRDDLVAQKIDQIRACDDELRALELVLGERRELREVREPGIGGTCPRCFAVFGSADRFCATCGAALGGAVQSPAQVPAPAPPAVPPEAGGPSQ